MIQRADEAPEGQRGSATKALRARIAERARALWLAEGKPKGREKTHWLMAIALVTAERQQGYGQRRKPDETACNEAEACAGHLVTRLPNGHRPGGEESRRHDP